MTTTAPASPGATLAPTRTGLRVAAGAALVAVLTRTASIFLWPPDADASHAKMLATAGAHPTAWYAATWAEVVCWVAAGAAVLTATALVRGRGVVPTRVGGWVYGAALLTLGLVGGSQNVVTGVLGSQPDAQAMLQVQDAMSSAGPMAPFVALVVLGEPFVIVFAAGLSRSRLVGWWYTALAVASGVGYVLTADSSDHLVVLLGFLPLAALWLVLARLLDRASRATA